MRLRWTTLPRGVRYDLFMTPGGGRNPDKERPFRTEANVKRLLFSCVMLGLSVAPITAQTVPELPFESVQNPLTMPDDVHFGEIAGVAVNSKGHVFVFSRGNSTGPAYMATAAQLLEFDAKGKFIREIGKNLYAWSYAHAVRIDKDDNIWVVDKGSDMILKMNPEGPRRMGVRPQGRGVALHGAARLRRHALAAC